MTKAKKSLPHRPNLDHLRKQAKTLLAAVHEGDAQAVATLQQHLPAARDMSADDVRRAGFRLADAQSAIARSTGFASWPKLSRHVEQLRALEGTWRFASLQVGGAAVPDGIIAESRLLIDGDLFLTEAPEARYEGVFNIDVETEPHGIDIEFVAGPEAGRRNLGIFRLDGDGLQICLDMSGASRPARFVSTAKDGFALETLRRAARARPDAVTGGDAGGAMSRKAAAGAGVTGFEHVPSPLLARLQGEWSAEEIVRDGQTLPAAMLRTATRSASENEVKIAFGGKVLIHALVRLDESASPTHVDYYNLAGPAKGSLQHGIMEWTGGVARFCMAAPGDPRPADFTAAKGSGRTLSAWRPQAR